MTFIEVQGVFALPVAASSTEDADGESYCQGPSYRPRSLLNLVHNLECRKSEVALEGRSRWDR